MSGFPKTLLKNLRPNQAVFFFRARERWQYKNWNESQSFFPPFVYLPFITVLSPALLLSFTWLGGCLLELWNLGEIWVIWRKLLTPFSKLQSLSPLMIFSRMSCHCKLVPVPYRKYENVLLNLLLFDLLWCLKLNYCFILSWNSLKLGNVWCRQKVLLCQNESKRETILIWKCALVTLRVHFHTN